MSTQVKRRKREAQKLAATIDRNFRTFLLVSQFEAKAIGARIALARNEAGLTQEELAGAASFSRRSLQDYEAGVTIPYKHMREISALLQRPVEWFLHGEDVEVTELSDRVDHLQRQLDEVLDLLRRERDEGPPETHS